MRIVFLLSRRNKRNKGNLVTLTLRSSFCPFCSFCGTLLSHAHSIYCPDFYCPAEIKEIAEIIVTEPREVLSALSAGHYYHYLIRIVFLLSRFILSRRNKGNSRNYSYSPPRSSFCSFCGTLLAHAHSDGQRHLPSTTYCFLILPTRHSQRTGD